MASRIEYDSGVRRGEPFAISVARRDHDEVERAINLSHDGEEWINLLPPSDCAGTYTYDARSEKRDTNTAVKVVAPNLPSYEIDALHALYNATQGEHWIWYETTQSGIPWVFSPSCNPCESKWQGVNCTDVPVGGFLHITVIELNAHNLNGTIPSALMDLSYMRVLILSDNHLHNTIPSQIGSLQALAVLDLDTNCLTGTIPSEIGSLQAITLLDLDTNYLTGIIPAGIGNLRNMTVLDLDTNLLTGTIPSQICNLEALTVLDLFSNYLSGSIPLNIGDLQAISILDLFVNHLTGTIPAQIGNMQAMTVLDVDTNYLTGTIPVEVGILHALTVLDLRTNYLTGTIPIEIGNLQTLVILYLHTTYLTGTLPPEIGNLQHLNQLSFHNTLLHGSIPSSYGNMTALSLLDLSSNALTSTVPASLQQLRHLGSLFLSNNHLSGQISQIINPTYQHVLLKVQLDSNRFTGPIPDALFALPKLQTAVLGDNCFSGSLPAAAMCSAPQLLTLSLDGLHSGSSCRHELFPGASKVYVLTEPVDGGVPTCLFEMRLLNTLHLSGNGLRGSLPGNVSIGESLVDVALSYNALTGPIPSMFQDRIWYNLDLSYNRFLGTVNDHFATVPGNLSTMARVGITAVNGTTGEYSNPYGAVILRNNRLSDTIPSVFSSMLNVSILNGNMFDCALDQHDLPRHDGGAATYSCGSNAFNVPFYIYLGVLFAVACVTGLVYALRQSLASSTVLIEVQNVHLLMNSALRHSISRLGQQHSLQRYVSVLRLFNEVCAVAACCTVYIIAIGTPLYVLCSHYYGTHTYVYALSVSAAYLSGPTAMALLMLILCMLLVLLQVLQSSLVQRVASNMRAQTSTLEDTARAPSQFSSIKLQLAIYMILFSVNTLLVGAANVGFVLAATYGGTTAQGLAQIALSVFKLLWGNSGLVYLIRGAQQRLSTTAHAFFGLQLFMQLFNMIVVPCVVTALLSPDCFNSAIVATPTVTTHYATESCVKYLMSTNVCIEYESSFATSSYDPPFTYSYQCSSSLISFYAPTFVYTGLIVTFIHPVLSWAQRAVYVRVPQESPWKRVLQFLVPRIQRPIGAAASVALDRPYNPLRPYWDANHRTIMLLTYLGVLLTFGLVFPPIALVMLTSMCSAVLLSRIVVGRFLSDAIADKVYKYCDIIDAECEGVGSVPQLHQAARVLGFVVCAFYAPFMFDTLGDAQGARKSLWVLVVTPLLPCAVMGAVYCRNQWHKSSYGNDSSSSEETPAVVADIELNAMSIEAEGSLGHLHGIAAVPGSQQGLDGEGVIDAPVFNVLQQR